MIVKDFCTYTIISFIEIKPGPDHEMILETIFLVEEKHGYSVLFFHDLFWRVRWRGHLGRQRRPAGSMTGFPVATGRGAPYRGSGSRAAAQGRTGLVVDADGNRASAMPALSG
jgi:hypothetical protein